MLSPDGISYTFDANANGFGYGEGCIVVIIKSLEDAINEGNNVYGIVESSGV